MATDHAKVCKRGRFRCLGAPAQYMMVAGRSIQHIWTPYLHLSEEHYLRRLLLCSICLVLDLMVLSQLLFLKLSVFLLASHNPDTCLIRLPALCWNPASWNTKALQRPDFASTPAYQPNEPCSVWVYIKELQNADTPLPRMTPMYIDPHDVWHEGVRPPLPPLEQPDALTAALLSQAFNFVRIGMHG